MADDTDTVAAGAADPRPADPRTVDSVALPEAPARGEPVPSSASRRVRARLARRMTATRSQVRPVLEPLVTLHRDIYPKADIAKLQRAYDVAKRAKRGDVPRREPHSNSSLQRRSAPRLPRLDASVVELS